MEYIYNTKSVKGLLYTVDSNAIYLISLKQFRTFKKGSEVPIAETKFVPITSVDKLFTRKPKSTVSRIIGVGITLWGVSSFFSGGWFPVETGVTLTGVGIIVTGFNWKYFKPYEIGANQSNYLEHIAELKSLCTKK